MSLFDYFIDVLIYGLLNVNVFTINFTDMQVNIPQRIHTFLQFHIGPPFLNTKCRSPLSYQLNRQHRYLLIKLRMPPNHLNCCCSRSSIKQRFEKAQELLLNVKVKVTVVVENSEEH